MAYNRRRGGFGGGGRFNNGGSYRAGPGSIDVWQYSPGSNGPLPLQTQQIEYLPLTLPMDIHLINKLLTLTNTMVTINRMCVMQIIFRCFHLLMMNVDNKF